MFDYQRLNITHVWMAQRIFADDLAGNLAFDKDGDGTLESLTKLRILQQAVLAKCDANDGIQDGVIRRSTELPLRSVRRSQAADVPGRNKRR